MARRRQRDKKRTPFVGVKACCGTMSAFVCYYGYNTNSNANRKYS